MTPFKRPSFNNHLSLLGKREEEEIRQLSRGDYFGEQALLKTDIRTANVIATSDTVEVFAFDRESFYQLVGELDELQNKQYDDQQKVRKGTQ